MDFIIGALAYFAKEPEYDEEGNVKPVEFSSESLCAFLQVGHAPDDVEFITTVKEVKSIEALGHTYWTFKTIYRGGEDNEEEIPTYALKSEKNNSLDEASQLQGLLYSQRQKK